MKPSNMSLDELKRCYDERRSGSWAIGEMRGKGPRADLNWLGIWVGGGEY